jgi:Ca-activated chloride channel family protein
MCDLGQDLHLLKQMADREEVEMEFQTRPRILTDLAVLLLVSRLTGAQHLSATTHAPSFGATTELVAVPVSVTDHRGHTVVGLRLEDFVITENGVPQQVLSASRWNVASSIGVVFDGSGSMKTSVSMAQSAVRTLLKDNGPEDEAFLIRFADTPQVVVDFTHDADAIADKVIWNRPRGATALFDAVYAALNKVKRAENSRKALVVITDGGDNNSRYSFPELLALSRESYAQVYIVAIRRSLRDQEEQRGRLRLDQIANETGGRLLIVDSSGELPHALATVNDLIRNQYLLTYRPAGSRRDGKWHPVRVRIQPPSKAPAYRVYARGGYYAPE